PQNIPPPTENNTQVQQALQDLKNIVLPNNPPQEIPEAATGKGLFSQPPRPGTVRSFLNSINDRLDKVHPAAKYVVWSVLGVATAAGLVCAIIYAGGWQDAVKQGLKEFFDWDKAWSPIFNAVKVGAVTLITVGVISSPETYRPGELRELGKLAAVGFGVFAAYATGIGLAFALRY
ncbi:MAG: hypothetical protein JSR80_07175, partial [Verrucomicrobia bacterium]|nr:hypothetical protein [Verrucomicrobiota bacterium]